MRWQNDHKLTHTN